MYILILQSLLTSLHLTGYCRQVFFNKVAIIPIFDRCRNTLGPFSFKMINRRQCIAFYESKQGLKVVYTGRQSIVV